MRQGSLVELEMKKVLRSEDMVDMKLFQCEILKHDVKRECIYLLLESGQLTEISLDALYECRIDLNDEKVMCEGRVRERYQDENGNVLEFQIENGFYKINIKSVDKQES